MTSAMHLNVGPGLMPDFMTGALFHTILAWPLDTEAPQFHRVSQELMAQTLRQTLRQNPTIASDLKQHWPMHDWDSIGLAARRRRPSFNGLETRLRQRMVAAKIGIGLAHEQIFGNPAVLPLSLTALSIDQLTHLVRHEVYITNPENIERLVWRKSLPVIHLAIAVQLMLTGRFKDRSEWGCDLQDVDFYRQAVLLAQALEPVVLNHAKINITSDKLTQLRWYE